MTSFLFLIGGALAVAGFRLKSLPLRAVTTAIAMGCFAIGGADIGKRAAENAHEAEKKAAAQERAARAAEPTESADPDPAQP